MTILDRSNYLKALLILIAKDRKISYQEKSIVTKIGTLLGFDLIFVEDAISEILDNEYISQDPPVFSDRRIAETFLKDGLKVAYSDNDLDSNELKWLKQIAEKNNVSEIWLNNNVDSYITASGNETLSSGFELESLTN